MNEEMVKPWEITSDAEYNDMLESVEMKLLDIAYFHLSRRDYDKAAKATNMLNQLADSFDYELGRFDSVDQ